MLLRFLYVWVHFVIPFKKCTTRRRHIHRISVPKRKTHTHRGKHQSDDTGESIWILNGYPPTDKIPYEPPGVGAFSAYTSYPHGVWIYTRKIGLASIPIYMGE